MHRRAYLSATAAFGTVAIAGCTDVLADDSDSDCDIGMTANAFTPEEYVTEVGSTVVWCNTSSRGHNVVAVEGSYPEEAEFFSSGPHDSYDEEWEAWDSASYEGMLSAGETFSHTFEVPGTYQYVCFPHIRADMFGTVIVEA